MDLCGLYSPAKCIAALFSPLYSTYPVVRKGTRPEICTSSTVVAIHIPANH